MAVRLACGTRGADHVSLDSASDGTFELVDSDDVATGGSCGGASAECSASGASGDMRSEALTDGLARSKERARAEGAASMRCGEHDISCGVPCTRIASADAPARESASIWQPARRHHVSPSRAGGATEECAAIYGVSARRGSCECRERTWSASTAALSCSAIATPTVVHPDKRRSVGRLCRSENGLTKQTARGRALSGSCGNNFTSPLGPRLNSCLSYC